MNATVHLSPKTSHQTSTIGKVLLWMQNNEKQLRNTNCSQLGRTIAISEGMNTDSTRMVLQRMVNNQILNRHGNKRRASFYINYYHKDIPGYVIENAPQYIKDRIKSMKENLADNQHIDKVGCVVTEPEKKEEEKETCEKPVEIAPQKQDVVVPVEVKDDSKGLSLTITLNINLNR